MWAILAFMRMRRSVPSEPPPSASEHLPRASQLLPPPQFKVPSGEIGEPLLCPSPHARNLCPEPTAALAQLIVSNASADESTRTTEACGGNGDTVKPFGFEPNDGDDATFRDVTSSRASVTLCSRDHVTTSTKTTTPHTSFASSSFVPISTEVFTGHQLDSSKPVPQATLHHEVLHQTQEADGLETGGRPRQPEALTEAQLRESFPPDVFSQKNAIISECDCWDRRRGLKRSFYVGKLRFHPPPDQLKSRWQAEILPRLIEDLTAVLDWHEYEFFEAELRMAGRARNAEYVPLEPTVCIRCTSKSCRRIFRKALMDLDYLYAFSNGNVEVHCGAPRLAASGVPQEYDSVNHRLFVQHVNSGSSACGIKLKDITSDGQECISTIGGLIKFEDKIFGLTTAHGIIRGVGPTENRAAVGTNDGKRKETLEWVDVRSTGPISWPGNEVRNQSGATHCQSNSDFALIDLELSSSYRLYNRIPTPGSRTMRAFRWAIDNAFARSPSHGLLSGIKHDEDIQSGDAALLTTPNSFVKGYLLQDEAVFRNKLVEFKTRKIELAESLPQGISGAWVVQDNVLCGMVLAVYDNDPSAHIVTADTMFQNIKNVRTTMEAEVSVATVEDVDAACQKNIGSDSIPALGSETEQLQSPEALPPAIQRNIVRPLGGLILSYSEMLIRQLSQFSMQRNVVHPLGGLIWGYSEMLIHRLSEFSMASNSKVKFLAALFAALCCSCLSTFELFIITSLPKISAALDERQRYTWIINSHLLAIGIISPLYARLSWIFGPKNILMVALILSAVGSTILGYGKTFATVIVGYSIHTLGNAGLSQLSAQLVAEFASPKQRITSIIVLHIWLPISIVLAHNWGVVLAEHRWPLDSMFHIALSFLALVAIWPLPNYHKIGMTWNRQTVRINFAQRFLVSSLTALLHSVTIGSYASSPSWQFFLSIVIVTASWGYFDSKQLWLRKRPNILSSQALRNQKTFFALTLNFICYTFLSWIIFFLPHYFQSIWGAAPLLSTVLIFQFCVSVVAAMALGVMISQRRSRFLDHMQWVGFAIATISCCLSTLLDSISRLAIHYSTDFGIGFGLGWIIVAVFSFLMEFPLASRLQTSQESSGNAHAQKLEEPSRLRSSVTKEDLDKERDDYKVYVSTW